MFAARYAEFHQRMLDQDYQEAALNLVALFREGVAPKAWWGVLLADAIVLLQDGNSKIETLTEVGTDLRDRHDAVVVYGRLRASLSAPRSRDRGISWSRQRLPLRSRQYFQTQRRKRGSLASAARSACARAIHRSLCSHRCGR
jgi:hypothetical protein